MNLSGYTVDRDFESASNQYLSSGGIKKPIPVWKRKRLTASGFTLLELLVVIVIIGMLAAYVGPRYFSQIGKSERGAASAQIEALARALDAFRLDVGRYPSDAEGLAALTSRPGSAPNWNGPYLNKAVPNDPWGRPFQYGAPPSADSEEFRLGSLGKDGQAGGSGDAADIRFR